MSSSSALFMLKVLAENPEAKDCLAAFFEKERSYHISRTTQLILTSDMNGALKSAHFAEVYESAFREFEHFLKNEVRNVQVV